MPRYKCKSIAALDIVSGSIRVVNTRENPSCDAAVLAPTHGARKKCLQWLAVEQPSNQGGAYAPV
jgi:hypothetical protein